jgi:hypothetical protein
LVVAWIRPSRSASRGISVYGSSSWTRGVLAQRCICVRLSRPADLVFPMRKLETGSRTSQSRRWTLYDENGPLLSMGWRSRWRAELQILRSIQLLQFSSIWLRDRCSCILCRGEERKFRLRNPMASCSWTRRLLCPLHTGHGWQLPLDDISECHDYREHQCSLTNGTTSRTTSS